MQLYEVSFQTNYEDAIDCGKLIVCAKSNDEAADRVRISLDLPASRTVFTVNRIKENLFQMDRRQIEKNLAARASVAAFAPKQKFILGVTSTIRAASETLAWIKLGHAIIDRSKAKKAIVDPAVLEIESTCDAMGSLPPVANLSREAVYKEHQFVQGGAARPR